eukprot:scaffold5050_cov137-Amphora_coffeaeformis.AAC.2
MVAALMESRKMCAWENNWLLFATIVEVFFEKLGGKLHDETRCMKGIQKYIDWYVGDGVYGDGPKFHFDYYNSYVILPMLVQALINSTPAIRNPGKPEIGALG